MKLFLSLQVIFLITTLNSFSQEEKHLKTYRFDLNDSINEQHLNKFNNFSDSLFKQIKLNEVPIYSNFLLEDTLNIDLLKCRMEYLLGTSSSELTLCADLKNCHIVEFCEPDRDSIDYKYYRKTFKNGEMYPFNSFRLLEIQFNDTKSGMTLNKITFFVPAYDKDNISGIEYPIVSLDYKDIKKNNPSYNSEFVIALLNNEVKGSLIRENNKEDKDLFLYDKKNKVFIKR